MQYNKLSTFLKNKFGERVGKICIDAGFTCPNRDGKKGFGGCIFCSERGSGEHICAEKDIAKQVKLHLSSYKGKRVNKYIAYFQNFTNTYADVSVLEKRYDAALIDSRIVALAIATRPDCITEEVACLLEKYMQNYYVWVELGLQTANNKTGELLNRGYTAEDFEKACNILSAHNIPVVTHVMVGLPGESLEDVKKTVAFVNKMHVSGVKVHNVYVVANTKLADMYLAKEYTPISMEEYITALKYVITHISPDVVVHRINADAPKELLLAPEWNLHKKLVLNHMQKEDICQGMYYKKEE